MTSPYWPSKTNDELLEAARDIKQYRTTLQGALRHEMRKRGLPLPPFSQAEESVGSPTASVRSATAPADQSRRARSVSALTSRELAAFVKHNTDFYSLKWSLLEGSDSMLSWNWPAFFFGPLWMLYRKMWLYAVVYYIVLFVPVLNGILVPGALVMGAFGNEIYRLHALRRYAESLVLHADSAAGRLRYMGDRGGVSPGAVVLALMPLVLYLSGVVFLLALWRRVTS